MPATTRSVGRQPQLEELKDVQLKNPSTGGSAAKRKAPSKSDPIKHSTPSKRQKTSESSEGHGIIINRAPVLELWSASVIHFLNPDLPWTTCLSGGAAIATITAISKGRAIGKIGKPDPSQAAEKKAKQEKEGRGLEEIEVMGFHLKVKDGVARVGDQGKKGNEQGLKKKFGGDEDYSRAKAWFVDALNKDWRDKEEELNARAFGMYEDFRPTVPAGQKGWGRKGVLNQSTVQNSIQSS